MPISIKTNLPDGEWICRLVNSFCYGKDEYQDGITVSCKVIYATKEGTMQEISFPLNSLYNTIAGSRLNVNNGVTTPRYNSEQNRKLYFIKVAQEFASNESESFHVHLNLTDTQHQQAYDYNLDYQKLIQDLQFPSDFGYTYAHCIPATDSNPTIDYFIIPSYEVLRHFFLLGNRLPTQLLSYFTGEGEKATQSINELVIHPTGSPLIISHQGQRIAYLNVREGLSELERKCLARIAFIPQAFTCLERVKSSLLLGNLGEDFKLKTLQTILPQNKPFDIAACGRKFKWQEKVYVLVDQIYDTKEEMPFDHVEYNSLIDHRKLAHKPANVTKSPKEKPTLKTKLTDSYQLTASEPGDNSQLVKISESIETDYVFPDKSIITFNKLPKKNQKGYYSAAITTQQRDIISLLEATLSGARAGRGNVSRQEKSKIKTYDPHHKQVKPFFEALTLFKNYTCEYLNLDQITPLFSSKYYLNHVRLNSPYKVLLCLLKPVNEGKNINIYIAWTGTIRYSLFYAPDLTYLPISLLTEICLKHFSEYGVNSEWKEQTTKHYRLHLKSYSKHNPAELDATELVEKIEEKLAAICKHNKPVKLQ